MGMPLYLSLISLTIGIILWILSAVSKKEKKTLFDSLTGLFIILATVLWIIALALKDPITDLISRDAQLIIGGISLGGVAWKYYFDPTKRRIGNLEIGQGEIKTDIANIKTDLHMIKEKIIGQ